MQQCRKNALAEKLLVSNPTALSTDIYRTKLDPQGASSFGPKVATHPDPKAPCVDAVYT